MDFSFVNGEHKSLPLRVIVKMKWDKESKASGDRVGGQQCEFSNHPTVSWVGPDCISGLVLLSSQVEEC